MVDKDIRYSVTAEDRFSRVFASLKRDIAESGDKFGQLGTAAGTVNRLLGVGFLGATAGAGGLALGLRTLVNDIDKLNDASDAVGDSVANISALEDVARRNGEGVDLVTTALNKLNKTLGEGKVDSPVSRALQAIGLDAAKLRKESPSEALRQVAVALQGYENDGNKARLMQELFGKSSREVAAFLKDLAESGRLNATVTSQQAAEAEKFNKQLFALSANAVTAGRTLAGPLLTGINQFIDRARVASDTTRPLDERLQALFKTLKSAGFGALIFNAEDVDRLSSARKEVESIEAALKRTDISEERRADLEKKRIGRLQTIEKLIASSQRRPANEGGGGLASRKLPDLLDLPDPAKGAAAKVSEADRYLERLQREGDKVEELTALQQLLRDIERGRVEGLTPKKEFNLKLEASYVDFLRQQNKEIERQAGFQKILADKGQKDINDALSLLENTPTGQRQALERQVDTILKLSRSLPDKPENDPIQKQALEALDRIKQQFKELDKPVDDTKKKVDSLAVTVDKFAESSIDALVELGTTGKLATGGLFDAFKRDVLRALIEDPVKESMKSVVGIIKTELSGLNSESGALAGLFKLFASLASGGSGGAGLPGLGFGSGPSLTGGEGYTSRASGGTVRAGQLVRWQENGREWFRPGMDGTVATQAQMQGPAAAYSPTTIIHLNGVDPQANARQIRNMLDERDARMVRSMQSGRLRQV